MLYKRTYILLLTFLTCTISIAQDAKWSKYLTADLAEVGWVEQANNGLIIASGAKGIMALDNNSGEKIWINNELKSVIKSSYRNIDGLPIFYTEYSPLVGKTRGILIDSNNGDILYDTKDDGYRIKTYHLLPAQ